MDYTLWPLEETDLSPAKAARNYQEEIKNAAAPKGCGVLVLAMLPA
jgi:hypothetical protein